ncbi:hypothetical protein OEZ60_13265 [Defluviimonas sp. WL0024]|uniref:Uncharacterized protein n=1 Tax=Albidovulum salinarum TaxID=2984153 RepID=A0ABT2X4V1_9RHOB|nr:hypothetical protein [Defluviimonas sp. WL0024]MCU9848973.1 hypothetical protein [Defluviimonas sp. WL0024]
MATKGEMVRASADLFGENPNKVDAMARMLAQAGLRSPGGRGRAAAAMTGRDVFHLNLALAAGIETKDAPEFVSRLTELKLVYGELWQDDDIRWDVSEEILSRKLFAALNRLPVPGLKLAPTFGDFCGHWLDAGFEDHAGGFANAKVSVEVSTNGPHAVFSHQSDAGDLKIWFGLEPREIGTPVWERRVMMSDALFRKLSALAGAGEIESD